MCVYVCASMFTVLYFIKLPRSVRTVVKDSECVFTAQLKSKAGETKSKACWEKTVWGVSMFCNTMDKSIIIVINTEMCRKIKTKYAK